MNTLDRHRPWKKTDPRVYSGLYGLRIKPQTFSEGTWIEAEEFAMSKRGRNIVVFNRRARVILPETGKHRLILCGFNADKPNTWPGKVNIDSKQRFGRVELYGNTNYLTWTRTEDLPKHEKKYTPEDVLEALVEWMQYNKIGGGNTWDIRNVEPNKMKEFARLLMKCKGTYDNRNISRN